MHVVGGRRGEAIVLGALVAEVGVMDQGTVAVLKTRRAGTALMTHDPFLAPIADGIVVPREGCAAQPQPSSCSRSSSMPKWWAISWITVIATSSTTSASLWQMSSSASR